MNNHPLSIVIFGASGDLTKRKLVPALYNLYQKDRLPEIKIIGTSRSEYSHNQFRQHLLEGIHNFSPETFDQKSWEEFSSNIQYQQGDLTSVEDYQKLSDTLNELEGQETNRLYYLAISPEFYHQTIQNMGIAGLAKQQTEKDAPWTHIIIEKPYGIDLDTARELNKTVHKVFSEDQVYRIDH